MVFAMIGINLLHGPPTPTSSSFKHDVDYGDGIPTVDSFLPISSSKFNEIFEELFGPNSNDHGSVHGSFQFVDSDFTNYASYTIKNDNNYEINDFNNDDDNDFDDHRSIERKPTSATTTTTTTKTTTTTNQTIIDIATTETSSSSSSSSTITSEQATNNNTNKIYDDDDDDVEADAVDQCGNQNEINNNNNNNINKNVTLNAIERQFQRNNSSSSTTSTSSAYWSSSSINEEEEGGGGLFSENEDIQLKPIMIWSSHSRVEYGGLTRQLYKAWLPNGDGGNGGNKPNVYDNNDDDDDDGGGGAQEQKRSASEPDVETIYGQQQQQHEHHMLQDQQQDHTTNNVNHNNHHLNNDDDNYHQQPCLVNEIQTKFHRVNLFPTESQVFEMIQFASRCSKRRTLHSLRLAQQNQQQTATDDNHRAEHQPETGITFGEFCFFASVLFNSANLPPSRPLVPNDTFMSRLEQQHQNVGIISAGAAHYNYNDDNGFNGYRPLSRHGFSAHRSSLVDYSDGGTKFDLFLGGSCNPTRWRLDLVMPELKKNGITYYNPQVDDWGPELIQLENVAKQNSEVLFFVIDNQTRAIASMIEVAFIAASQRKLILVINQLEPWSTESKICGDAISQEEYNALNKGRRYLRDIVERQEIPIFTDIPRALRSAMLILREKVRPQDLPLSNDVIPVKNGHVSLGDKMIQMFHIYNQSNNALTFDELPMAYRTLTGRDVSSSMWEQMARSFCHRKSLSKDPSDLNTLPSLKDIPVDFNDFCIIISELETAFVNLDQTNQQEQQARISEASETTTEVDRKSLSSDPTTSASNTETDSDDYSHNERKNPKIKRKKKMIRKSSSIKSNDSGLDTNPIINRLTDKIINLFGGFFNLNTENSGPTNRSDEKIERKNKTTKPKHRHNKLEEQRRYSNTHQASYGHEYTMPNNMANSSQSLNHLNQFRHGNNLFNHPNIQSDHHKLSLGHHRGGDGGGSMRPFRKSLSPRIFHNPANNLDQSMDFNNRTSFSNDQNGHRIRRSSSIHHHHHHQHQYLHHHHQNHHHQYQPPPPPPQQPLRSNMISSSSQSSITSLLYENKSDLYIGGCIDSIMMKEKIQPLLKKHSITFSTPKFNQLINHERLIPMEAKNIENCRHLLFVIPEDTLDITFMIIAAHYIGLGYSVILCIQFIDETKLNSASNVSQMAIKDYNRGRSYLSDMATKSNVRVFDDVDEAVHCCIKLIDQTTQTLAT